MPAMSESSITDPIRVLIVEDSIVIRGLMTRALESDPAIRVVSSAGDGVAALKSFKNTPVDVIVLDIEMPIMDGITALPEFLKIDPRVRIIMASTLTLKNAEISLKALQLGAADYLPKPTTSKELAAADDFKRELIEKVKALGLYARRSGVRNAPEAKSFRAATPASPTIATEKQQSVATSFRATPAAADKPKAMPNGEFVLRPWPTGLRPELLAIGSSTGGPQALFDLMKALAGKVRVPVVITQHMPPSFTTILAEHINKQSNFPCAEAKDGDVLAGGKALLAPGNFHMLLQRDGTTTKVRVTQDPPENFCRPAVDPMLRSAVNIYGKNILTVILTGMGSDGCKGAEKVTTAGGAVIAQDEATSVVWGMPGAVAQAGLCSAVLPLEQIAPAVLKVLSGGQA